MPDLLTPHHKLAAACFRKSTLTLKLIYETLQIGLAYNTVLTGGKGRALSADVAVLGIIVMILNAK